MILISRNGDLLLKTITNTATLDKVNTYVLELEKKTIAKKGENK